MTGTDEGRRTTASNLIREVEKQRDVMISVATGGPRIDSVNDDYRNRRDLIRHRLDEVGLEDANPFQDLWEWYTRWSNGDLPSYRLRRAFLRDLFAPLLEQLAHIEAGRATADLREPTGWPRVDRQVEKMRAQLARAEHEEDFQAVGLLGRETLISIAQTVFEPSKHQLADSVAASDTDAGRMLAGYIMAELGGGANDEIRSHAKASLRMALALQHKRTADFRFAALCCEATGSLVSLIAIISGKRRLGADQHGDA